MSVPATDGGPIQNFVRSLYSGRFYVAAPFLGLGPAFRDLLLLGLILGLVTATQWSSATSAALVEWRAQVESGRMPAMKLDRGRLQVRGPQPYVRAGGRGGLVIIDTTGAFAGVPDSLAQGLFIGRDRAVFKSSPEISRTYDFEGQSLGFWLDADGLKRIRRFLVPAVLVAGTPIGLLYYVTVNLALAVLLAGFSLILIRAFAPAPGLSYRQVLGVALFALTPVSIVFRFLGLIVPHHAARLLPFYPAVAATLLLAALRASMRPSGPPGPPASS